VYTQYTDNAMLHTKIQNLKLKKSKVTHHPMLPETQNFLEDPTGRDHLGDRQLSTQRFQIMESVTIHSFIARIMKHCMTHKKQNYRTGYQIFITIRLCKDVLQSLQQHYKLLFIQSN